MNRLANVREALLRELSGSDARLRFINTRLILSVGVDLNEITPADDFNAAKIALTLQTLTKMGFLANKDGTRG